MTILLQGAGLQTMVVTPPDPIGDTLRADAVAYWKMEETSGSSRLDSTAHSHTLAENSGSLANALGKIGNALDVACDENGNPVLRNNDTYNFQDFTVSFWFKSNQLPARSTAALVMQLGAFTDVDYLSIEIRYSFVQSKISIIAYLFTTSSSGAEFVLSSNLDQWHFARVSRASGVISCSIDNATEITDTEETTLLQTYVSIGEGIQSAFHLYLDEVSLFSRVLTTDENDYLYNSGAGRTLFP